MKTATTLTSWSRAVRRALDNHGCDSAALFAQAGLDLAALNDPTARYSLSSTTKLWRLSVEATGNPCFGLEVASAVTQTTFHALGYSLAASSTLKEAFERIVRYFRLVTDAVDLEFVCDGDSYRFVIRPLSASDPPADEAVDAFVSLFIRFCRAMLGRGFSPLKIRLARPRPNSSCFEDVYRAPLEFGCAETEIWFPVEPFERRLETANPELARLNDEVTMRHLAQVERDDLLARVRVILIKEFPLGVPPAAKVATVLHLSLRSLQRKLSDEGSSYEEVVNATRRELALSYLEDRCSIGEITYLLGFSDASSFNRAFKRWTGKAPSQYRSG